MGLLRKALAGTTANCQAGPQNCTYFFLLLYLHYPFMLHIRKKEQNKALILLQEMLAPKENISRRSYQGHVFSFIVIDQEAAVMEFQVRKAVKSGEGDI